LSQIPGDVPRHPLLQLRVAEDGDFVVHLLEDAFLAAEVQGSQERHSRPWFGDRRQRLAQRRNGSRIPCQAHGGGDAGLCLLPSGGVAEELNGQVKPARISVRGKRRHDASCDIVVMEVGQLRFRVERRRWPGVEKAKLPAQPTGQ
jgi:hypothetical protein